MVEKVRMLGEVVLLAVFQDENATIGQQVVGENQVGNGGQLGKLIGRICKDEVELPTWRLDESEGIASYDDVVSGL